jgi:hypothetical protein
MLVTVLSVSAVSLLLGISLFATVRKRVTAGISRLCILLSGSRLSGGNAARLTVSRSIVQRSMTLLLVGLYLVILGVIGEGTRYVDVSFGGFSIVFLASTIGAVTALFEKLRRRLKVLISENFFIQKYDYRNEWLKFTGKLSSCRSLPDVHDAILSAYRQSFGLAGASLYLLDRKKETYTPAANQSKEEGCSILLTGNMWQQPRRRRLFDMPAPG